MPARESPSSFLGSLQANPGAAKHLQHPDGDPVVAFIIVEAWRRCQRRLLGWLRR
jgi:hypothetical protein